VNGSLSGSIHPLALIRRDARELIIRRYDAFPYRAAVKVAFGQQFVSTASGNYGCIVPMAFDDEIGGTPDIEVSDHPGIGTPAI
jgi:hypothetical protein